MRPASALLLVSLLGLTSGSLRSAPPATKPSPIEWAGFRGSGDSLTSAPNLPLHWSDRHNLAWQITLPGFGQSTPVVAGNQIFLTSVEGPKKQTLHVLSLAKDSGKELWRKSFPSSRPQDTGDRVARAASTPAVDERALYTLFDSGDLLAFRHNGELLWRKNFNTAFAPIQNGHDFGSSLRQSKDHLYAFVNHVGPSYLVALRKKDGSLAWRVDFGPEGGWNTPVLTTVQGQEVLLLQRSGGVSAYNAKTGQLLWEELGTFSRESAIPSLTVARGIAVIPSNGKGGTWAFRLDAPKQPLWRAQSATNGYSSPLLTAKRAYFVNSVGALFAVDLESGKDLWRTRLPSTTWASAVAAGDRLYFFTGEGDTFVYRDSEQMELLGQSHLEADSIIYAATPITGGFLIRSGTKLWRVANRGEVDPNPPAAKDKPSPPLSQAEPPPLPPAAPGQQPGQLRTNAVDGLQFAWLPAGTFRMGCSPEDAACEKDESPAHEVTLSRGFWLNTTEVTVGAYKKFAAATGTSLPAEPALLDTKLNPGWQQDNLPMLRVSYASAKAYCRWAGGRLPTEAEWEYAARAGTTTPTFGPLGQIAWSADNSGLAPLDSAKLAREQRGAYMPTLAKNNNRPHPVAALSPNAFGLFDMLGNVAEWTADWHDLYSATPTKDPAGPNDGEKRIARGGSWNFMPSALRASVRLKLAENSTNDFTGFRCAQ